MIKKNKYNIGTRLDVIDLNFETASFCVNHCKGCVFTQEQKDNVEFFNKEKLLLITEVFERFGRDNNTIMEFNLGPGEAFFQDKNTIMEYVKSMAETHIKYNKKESILSIAFASTLKIKDFKEKFNAINQYMNSLYDKYELAIELVFNIEDQNEIDIIADHVSYIYSHKKDLLDYDENILLNTVVKFSKTFLDRPLEYFYQTIKKIGVLVVDLEFTFQNVHSLKNLGTFEEFYKFYIKLKEYLEPRGIYLQTKHHDRDTFRYEELFKSIVIDRKLKLTPRLNVAPFGGIAYDIDKKEKMDFSGLTKNNIEYYINKLSIFYKKLQTRNNITIQSNKICQQCKFKNVCDAYYVTNLHKKYNIPQTKNMCLSNIDMIFAEEK